MLISAVGLEGGCMKHFTTEEWGMGEGGTIELELKVIDPMAPSVIQ